jgi:hypothetical protein
MAASIMIRVIQYLALWPILASPRVYLKRFRFNQIRTISTFSLSEHSDGFIDLFSDSLNEIMNKDLRITGKIPIWLNGTFIRNGPAVFGSIESYGNETSMNNKRKFRRYDHIFDGLAKLYKYDISNGKVKFSSKFLRSEWFKAIVEDKKGVPPSITTGPVTPKFDFAEKLIAAATSSSAFDNVPVNVHKLAGKTWVAVTGMIYQLIFT